MIRLAKYIPLSSHRVYERLEVLTLFSICNNTLSNWIALGLRPIKNTRSQLFRGAELDRFQKEMRQRCALGRGEVFCLACKRGVVPQQAKTEIWVQGRRLTGLCPHCGHKLSRALNKTEWDILQKVPDPNIDSSHQHKDMETGHICIGISDTSSVRWNDNNEILIFEWQRYANRFKKSTVAAHLATLRDFERFTGYKSLTAVTAADADAYRNHLTQRTQGQGGTPLSRSHVRHKAAALMAFWDWLALHFGSHLFRLVGQHFHLQKGLAPSPNEGRKRDALDISEAFAAFQRMPEESFRDRRGKAMIAAAYMFGLREHALVNLRACDINLTELSAFQDGTLHGAKNGKSYTANVFPGAQVFEDHFRDWMASCLMMGMRSDDPIFPRDDPQDKDGVFVPLKGTSAVDAAFRVLSTYAGRTVTPHSTRNTLANLGMERAKTSEERKCWSLNMGHEKETTTWENYAHVSQARKAEVLRGMSQNEGVNEAERIIALRFHSDCYRRGTPEYAEAQRIARKVENEMAAGYDGSSK